MRWNRAAQAVKDSSETAIGSQSALADRPVFAADRRWRQRSVNAVLGLGGALLVGWLVALIAGALGLGSLPALPLTGGGSETAAAPRSRPQPIEPANNEGWRDSTASGPLAPARPSGDGAQRPGGAIAHAPEAGRNHGGAASPVASGNVSPARTGPHWTANDNRAASTPNGMGGGTATGSVDAAGTGGGTRTSASAPPSSSSGARGAPEATPSGREVPGASESAPSAEPPAVAEAGLGAAHGKGMVAPG
jgi:hypothetical protein